MLPRPSSHLQAIVLFGLLFDTSAAQTQLTQNRQAEPSKAEFVYTDVEHFLAMKDALRYGSDSVSIAQSVYIDKGTPGLLIYIEKYGLTAKKLVAAMARYPQDYARIGETLSLLRSQEPQYRKAYGKLKELMSDASFPPTYFLVGAHRGIASGSTEGTLNTVEKEAEASIKGDFTATLVHEMTHLQQLRVLGEEYFTIFGEKKTLLALTIREGVAEFFAERVTEGETFKAPARRYLVEHEKKLWKKYKTVMLGKETGDWMWSQPKGQPADIAYVLGARIVASYYDTSSDKAEAVREILGVTDYPAFLKKSRYEERLARP